MANEQEQLPPISKFQQYKPMRVARKALKNAPYNPRIIDDSAKKKLKAAIKKEGLVASITWNQRTGNIVSGHQRVAIMDALERTKEYSLDVDMIDVDLKREKEINVQMNNTTMQGDFDLNKLADLNIDDGIDFDSMGFDKNDVDFMFGGDERFSKLYDNPEVVKEKDKLADIKKKRTKANEKLKDKNRIDFYDMIIFRDSEEREAFHRRISVPAYENKLSVEELERLKSVSDEKKE
ncbi:ParB N-terminal domain-containing protein [Schleiferilactobacillus shenzhenensis]|uniref:ParB/Sulfiredoxin domain-containing protein n=1 Tax=Schleiferilactobacillus shenzhenensis LY-73 TaxID=1231336 RepID=U4TGG6_9LACO|nr:ParB N-terminal domain-containing protein [Schleiferilactobacillus shenzhenensis]ERL63846.1 hypothetical protein L248_2139 [Schleiferilactobacillus shenzhenensis LY-73]